MGTCILNVFVKYCQVVSSWQQSISTASLCTAVMYCVLYTVLCPHLHHRPALRLEPLQQPDLDS